MYMYNSQICTISFFMGDVFFLWENKRKTILREISTNMLYGKTHEQTKLTYTMYGVRCIIFEGEGKRKQ